MGSDMVLSPLGNTIETAEITDGAVSFIKLGTDIEKWKLLETLTFTAEATKTTGALTAYKKYMVVIKDLTAAVAGQLFMRYNGISAANYQYEWESNLTNTLTTNGTGILIGSMLNNVKHFFEIEINGTSHASVGGFNSCVIKSSGFATAGNGIGKTGYYPLGNNVQVSTITLVNAQNMTGTAEIYGCD